MDVVARVEEIKSAHRGMPSPVSIMSLEEPVPTMYVFVP